MAFSFNENYLSCSRIYVAMIVANSVSGDSRVLKTAYSLSRRGYQVHIYGLSSSPRKEVIEGYPFKIILAPNPRYAMSREGVWYNSQNQQNFDLFIDRLTIAIQDSLIERNYDILHTHDMVGLPIGGRLRERGVNFSKGWIHDLHEHVEGCTNIADNKRLFYLRQEERYIHGADTLTTVSPTLSRLIFERYKVSPPHIVMNTPRLSDFDPYYSETIRHALDLRDETSLLVYSGGVTPVRGVQFAVEALPLLPDVHLALLTNPGSPYLKELLHSADKIGVKDRLHVHPYVPSYAVTSFLRGASAGINPVTIYGNSDLALPNKLFEYLHAGVPIVSTATSEVSDLFNENACGVTFPVGDVSGFANAIRELFSRFPEGLPDAGQGSELAKRFCWEEQEKVLFSLYDEMLSRHQDAPGLCPASDVQPIVQLPVHAANQPGTMARAAARLGYDARLAAFGRNRYGYEDDKAITEHENTLSSVEQYLSKQELGQFETYHYHARPLLYDGKFGFPTGLDLILLKAMGKRVFFHFRGSEIRLPSVFKKMSPYQYVDESKSLKNKDIPLDFDEWSQRAFRDFACGICDGVFVSDPELQCYVPDSLIVPRAVDLKAIEAVEIEGVTCSIPFIVHAPSRRGVKGTESVITAIEQLKSEGHTFEFQLVENFSNAEALAVFRKASIIIDQLRIGWYGVLAMEGMAMGKAVVSYVRNDLRHYLPNPPPLVYANPDNITDVLSYLLENPGATADYGMRGRKFVEEYHDADKVVKTLMQIYRRPVRPVDPVAVAGFLMHQSNKKSNKASLRKHGSKLWIPAVTSKLSLFVAVVKRYGLLTALKKTAKSVSKKRS